MTLVHQDLREGILNIAPANRTKTELDPNFNPPCYKTVDKDMVVKQD
ncbi:PREDICTED: LOW QUALITY PROTEIN: DNA-directed RNA polymerase II subunit RPB7 [Phaethon lepturus]|nr:PREDICTED: LOW QUALITY PROTEIN: DNA-directed RNA polymerase II subunit RPB7 [Phaethon lepturus]